MNIDFFTFGGSFFWEDVFFYQKWRIQRHCFTKRYRLLDSWDIRRASGTFEKCQKAFIKYMDCYEITKQNSHMVILIHGYLDSKNIFKNLWRRLILTNSTVAAINYPSLFRGALSNSYQLLFFLNHMEDIEEVSFVTKGAGNLVLRKMLNLPLELQTFRESVRIRNIVEINPVIRGNIFCDLLNKFKIFNFLFGPMIEDMTEKQIKNMPSIPNEIKSLKIFSESKACALLVKMLKLCKFPVDNFNYNKKDSIIISEKPLNVLSNDSVLNSTVKFINNGKI